MGNEMEHMGNETENMCNIERNTMRSGETVSIRWSFQQFVWLSIRFLTVSQQLPMIHTLRTRITTNISQPVIF